MNLYTQFVINLLQTIAKTLVVGDNYGYVVVAVVVIVIGLMSMKIVLGLSNTVPIVDAGLKSF